MASTKYTPETLQKALKEVNDGIMTVYKASKTYKIPCQTLYDKINEKYKKQDRTGAPTVLTPAEEALIVEWIIMMGERGFPVTKELLIHSVHQLVVELGRANKFKEGYPGRHWYEGFLKRNPSISKRVCQPLTTARVAANEEKIRAWFLRVGQYFEENEFEEVLKDPSRIFNCDESAFFLCPKGQAVLARTGSKSVYCRSGNNDRECLTILLGASADGKLMPTLALFPYKRIPANILTKYPKNWSIGRSDSGWMTAENFYEYVGNVFNSYLTKENIQKPVVLFLDGHVSHLSYHLCKLCKEIGIILVALLPNSTHALQPMDVAVFHSLKSAWSKNVYSWRMENNARSLKREDFGPLVEKSILETLKQDTIKNGFRKCGLYPFDENAIDYSRLISNSAPSSNTNSRASSVSSLPQTLNPSTTKKSSDFTAQFEDLLGIEKLQAFEQCSGEWNGDIRDENLYYLWKKIREIDPTPCARTVATPDSMHLGDSTIDANDCTLTGINLDWPNDDLSVLDMLVDKDNTLIPCSTPNIIINHVSKNTSNTDQKDALEHDSNYENNPELVPEQNLPGTEDTTKYKSCNNEKGNENENKDDALPEMNKNNIETIEQAHIIKENSTYDNNTVDTKMDITNKDLVTELTKKDDTSEVKETDQCTVISNTIETTPKSQNTTHKTPEIHNKSQSEIPDTQQSHFPTPFKNALLWPETPSSSGKTKVVRKKLIPTVATSEEYIEYQRRLDQEKKDKIEKAEQRKQDRANKQNKQKPKGKKNEKGRMKSPNYLDDETTREELNESREEYKERIEKAEERKQDRANKQNKQKPKGKNNEKGRMKSPNYLEDETTRVELNESREEYTERKEREWKTAVKGDFVVVNYEGQKFPGQIIRIDKNTDNPKYVVKTMTMSGFVNGKVNWRWPDKEDILDYNAKDILKKIKPPLPVNKRGVFSVPDI